MKQAVIFAGGRGERLKPITDSLPKPMAPINGIPFLDYLVASLYESGIQEIIFLVGYKYEVIVNHFNNMSSKKLNFKFSIGATEDLTGKRLINAHNLLDDEFLLLYGDNYWPNIPLNDMCSNFRNKNVLASTTVYRNLDGKAEYGFENNTYVSKEGLVLKYDKSRKDNHLNGVDIGFFLIKKELVNPKESRNISFEEVVLSKLAQEKQLCAYLTDQQYYFITNKGTLKDFEIAAQEFSFNYFTKKN